MQKDTLYLAQEARHDIVGIAGRVVSAFVFQFVLWGVLLGTPVWFGYWLFFD
ncbi:MAG: hypothetical protein OXH60_04705 [Rhodospirillales bacterium]|nr:hypothetical protein [Rhodospirillales bacterium]